MGLKHSNGIRLRPQRLLERRIGLRLDGDRLLRAEPDHLDAAHLQRGERDCDVEIVRIVAERLLQHGLCRAKALARGLVDRGERLLDGHLVAARRRCAAHG